MTELRRNSSWLWRQSGIWFGLLLLCLFFSLAADGFLSRENFLNILRQISITAILAVGATFVILAAGIDLSVGSVLALSSMVMALIFRARGPTSDGLWLGLCACLAIGAVVGLANGLLVTLGRIHSFVATLGTMAICRSLSRIVNDGVEIGNFSDRFDFIAAGFVWIIPFPVLLMFAVYGLSFVLLRWTVFGRLVYAIGSNKEACRLAGIQVRLYETMVYVLAGLLAALGGIIYTSRVGSASSRAGIGLELEVIAAVVVGGTSLSGGRGGVVGTFCGALLMGVLTTGLILMDVKSDWQGVVIGLIVIAAVVIDRLGQGK